MPAAQASHLLGSTISYKHLKDKQYQITAVLYRDCNECSLGDHGGGSSGVKCDDLETLYLAVSDQGECSRKNLGKINLERVGFSNVTQVCSGTKTACDQNPDVNFGIERHEYSGTVDFDNYSSYQGCGFEIFMLLSNARNTTGTVGTEQSLYNYTYVNPWLGDNTIATLTEEPRFYADCQRSFKGRMGGSDPDGDRLSFHLMPPKTGVSTNLNYNLGFSAINPLTVWCNGESNCNADPQSNPPKGFYLSPHFGDLIFHPTKCDEAGLFVVETREWRWVDGKEQLVGISRQDIQITARTPFENNAPIIKSDVEFTACIGDSLNRTIQVLDVPFRLADGSNTKQDSVEVSFVTNLPDGAVQVKSINKAPYREVTIQFLPTTAQSGKTFFLRLFAKDNFCPVPGVDVATIEIKVAEKPNLDLDGKIVFCDWLEILSPKEAQVWQISGDDSVKVPGGKKLVQLEQENNFHFFARMENTEGCVAVDSFKGTWTKDHLISYTLPEALCEQELFKVKASSRFKINRLNWNYDGINNSTSETETSDLKAGPTTLIIEAQLENNDYKCAVKRTVVVPVIQLPEITVNMPELPCAQQTPFNLESISITPSGGKWYYHGGDGDLVGNSLEWNPVYASSHELEYVIEDESKRCSRSKSMNITTRESPQMTLKDLVACKNLKKLKLAYFLDGSFNFYNVDFKWDWDGPAQNLLNRNDQSATLQLEDLPVGSYSISLEVTNEYGCTKLETANFQLQEDRKVTSNEVSQLCATDTIDLKAALNVSPTSGYWSSGNSWDIIDNRYLIPGNCETIQLTYTIDEFGCYSSKELEFTPICGPKNLPTIPTLICESADPIVFQFDGWKTATWEVNGASSARFEPSEHPATSRISFSGTTVEGCTLNKTWDVQIEQTPTFGLESKTEPWCEGVDFEATYNANGPFDISLDCSEKVEIDADLIRISNLCDGTVEMNVVGYGEACPSKEWTFSFNRKENPVIPNLLGITSCSNQGIKIDLRKVPLTGQELTWSVFGEDGKHMYSGSHSEPAKLLPLKTGQYDLSVTLVSPLGCTSQRTMDDFITILQAPRAMYHIDRIQFLQNERSFTPENLSSAYGEMSYKWMLGNQVNIAVFNEKEPKIVLPATPGLYELTLEASNAECTDQFSQTLQVLDQTSIFIPNAFSPDTKGPEENRTFGVSGNYIALVEIEVHNRWGQLMFTTDDGTNRWDGNSRGGNACASGTYFYQITVTDKDGHEFGYAGTVNLLR